MKENLMTFKATQITLYPAGDIGWEVVVTDNDGIEEGDVVWFETKTAALKYARKRFNAELTVKALIALNKEHLELQWNPSVGRNELITVTDKRIVRHR
jgi:hypothetical protein